MMKEAVELPASALAALARGQKIEAIKHAREELGLGLKEAKELVEDYERNRPAETANPIGATGADGDPVERSPRRSGAPVWLVVVIALLAGAGYLFYLRS